MKWTIALILVVSLAAGITHAAVTNTNTRPTACARGQVRVRDRCVPATNSNPSPPPAPPTPPPQVHPQARQLNPSTTNTCPLGQTLRNGKCSPKQCPAGMAVNGEGKCDCAPGFKKENNRCINETALQSCPPGASLSRRGNCVTPTSKPVKVCPQNTRLNAAGKCEAVVQDTRPCPSGQRKNRKGACIPIVVGESCGTNLWIDAQGNCGTTRVNNGCPEGKERNQVGNCVKIQICTVGQVKDKFGVCQSCGANQQIKNGQCVDIVLNSVAGRG